RDWSATTTITSGHDIRTVAGRLSHANAAMTLRVWSGFRDAHVTLLGDQPEVNSARRGRA
ncbi:MAG TPA: hypothetical protein VKI23_06145, partial [Cellulomonadaceae bacterium]|nr:hypothetical protein [Cellulomonadaceae bacterium]